MLERIIYPFINVVVIQVLPVCRFVLRVNPAYLSFISSVNTAVISSSSTFSSMSKSTKSPISSLFLHKRSYLRYSATDFFLPFFPLSLSEPTFFGRLTISQETFSVNLRDTVLHVGWKMFAFFNKRTTLSLSSNWEVCRERPILRPKAS